MDDAIPCPLELEPTSVKPEWIDHNGHMNVAFYLLAFDQAAGGLDDYLGLSREYKARTNSATFVGDVHVNYQKEVKVGAPLRLTAQVIANDSKRVHFWMEMFHQTEGFLVATAEFIILHIDMSVRRVSPMPDTLVERIAAVRRAHDSLGTPEGLGRVINVPQPV